MNLPRVNLPRVNLHRATLRALAVLGTATSTFALAYAGCCWECSSTCEETCDVSTNYCLVVWGHDPDGSNVYAHCTPHPAACAGMVDCACLLADLKADPGTSACVGDAKSGFRVDDCTDRQGGNCPSATSSSTGP